MTNLNFIIVSDIFVDFLNFANYILSELETTLIFEISILGIGAIILLSKQLGKKALEGLYATAVATSIAKTVYDVSKEFKNKGSGSSSDNNKDKNKKNDKKKSGNNSSGNSSTKISRNGK